MFKADFKLSEQKTIKADFEIKSTGTGGTSDHNKLSNRDLPDQHPISAITGLQNTLSGLQSSIGTETTERENADTVLSSQIDANADAILKTREDLQADIDENMGDIASLQSDTTTIRSDLDDLGDQVSGIEGKIPQNASTTNQLATKLDLTNAEQELRSEYMQADGELQQQINGQATAITNAQSDILSIESKIPETATSTNKLADQNFVNSSIATETATFKGTYNSVAELDNVSADNNDYAFVISTDEAGNTVYNRYKYANGSWVFEYSLNNSSFTAQQWATINSGATTANIGQISTNTGDISSLQSGKADKATTLAGYGITDAYTKSTADSTFVPQTRTVNGKALSSNISLTASDVGALADDTVIPTVNDSTITLQQNGATVDSFTLNQASNKTINIETPDDYYTRDEIDSIVPQDVKTPVVYFQPTTSYCYDENDNRFYGSRVSEKLYLVQPKTSGTTQVIDMSTTFSLDFSFKYLGVPSSTFTLAEIMVSSASGKGVLLQVTSVGMYYRNNITSSIGTGTRSLVVGNTYDVRVEYNGTKMIISWKLSTDANYTEINATTCTVSGTYYNYASIGSDGDSIYLPLSSVVLVNDGTTLYDYVAGKIALDYDETLTLDSNQLSVVVDQTYDGTSANPQSGIAINTKLGDYALSSSLATVATSGSYNDLSNKPTIPNRTSQLTNDSGFVTNEIIPDVASDSNKLVAKSELPTLVDLAQAGEGIEFERKVVQGGDNYTIVGSPDIDANGIFTASSTANYISSPEFDSFEGQNFEIEFTTPSSIGTSGAIVRFVGTGNPISIGITTSYKLYISTPVSLQLQTTLSTDTSYVLKFISTGGVNALSLYSSDGTLLEEKTNTNSITGLSPCTIQIGRLNLPFKFDLNKMSFGDWRARTPAFDGYEISSTGGGGTDISSNKVNGAPLSNTSSYFFGVCETPSSTAEKVVSIPSITELNAGQFIFVLPTYSATSGSSTTIKLNDFTAYPVKYGNASLTSTTDGYVLYGNYPSMFIFDGNYWVFAGQGYRYIQSYSSLTVAEGIAGTASTGRLVRADYLKQIIQGTTLTDIDTTTSSTVVATDSITTAIGKLQAQITTSLGDLETALNTINSGV